MLRRCFALPAFLLAAVASMAVGCASSTPTDIDSAQRLRVAYFDFRTGKHFEIGDRDDPQFRDLYSKKQSAAGVKVTDAEHLKQVVSELAAADYFEYAGNLAGPEQVSGEGPYKFFLVTADGHPYSLYLAKGVAAANKDIALTMSKATDIVMRAFNDIPQLQWVDTQGKGSEFYKDEQKQLQEQNKQVQKSGTGGRK